MNTVLKQQPVDDVVIRSLEDKDFRRFWRCRPLCIGSKNIVICRLVSNG